MTSRSSRSSGRMAGDSELKDEMEIFSDRVRPICLPSADATYENLGTCTVAGWGRTFAISATTRRPNEVELSFSPDSRCESFFGSFNYTSSKACASSSDPQSRRPCPGDSGGPLCVVRGRSFVYGLVSSGPLCGLSSGPDLFTRINKYIRWIQEKVAPSLLTVSDSEQRASERLSEFRNAVHLHPESITTPVSVTQTL
ncbi:prostasin-like [Penaeus japonicus]|uniref:prostasin-like n=1 Tax=Penaeus japonicus TaxID=27405 RepID=UPI001C71022B|nr:prostasin-like [Penaeus japonicus]